MCCIEDDAEMGDEGIGDWLKTPNALTLSCSDEMDELPEYSGGGAPNRHFIRHQHYEQLRPHHHHQQNHPWRRQQQQAEQFCQRRRHRPGGGGNDSDDRSMLMTMLSGPPSVSTHGQGNYKGTGVLVEERGHLREEEQRLEEIKSVTGRVFWQNSRQGLHFHYIYM